MMNRPLSLFLSLFLSIVKRTLSRACRKVREIDRSPVEVWTLYLLRKLQKFFPNMGELYLQS